MKQNSMKNVLYKRLGEVDYMECWKLQERYFDALVGAKSLKGNDDIKVDGNDITGINPHAPEQVLILCGHPHVYTLGKSGVMDNMLIGEDFLKEIGASFCRTNRGGDITYHGPGQLVGYPVLDLEVLGLGLKEYIRLLEETVINTVADFGIKGVRSEGATGVWLEQGNGKGLRKICAIGVKSSRYVTMHGFALNVDTDMRYFNYINPCGFTDRGVTSLKAETGEAPVMDDVCGRYKGHFEKVFGVSLI